MAMLNCEDACKIRSLQGLLASLNARASARPHLKQHFIDALPAKGEGWVILVPARTATWSSAAHVKLAEFESARCQDVQCRVVSTGHAVCRHPGQARMACL